MSLQLLCDITDLKLNLYHNNSNNLVYFSYFVHHQYEVPFYYAAVIIGPLQVLPKVRLSVKYGLMTQKTNKHRIEYADLQFEKSVVRFIVKVVQCSGQQVRS